MKTTQLKKNLIIIALTALLLGVMIVLPNMPVLADDEEAPAERAQIYMDYLGRAGQGGGLGPQNKAQVKPGFTLNDLGTGSTVFWVGIRLDKLEAVQFMKDGGLRDLEIGIEYNPEYVRPCDDLQNPTANVDAVDKAAWAQIIEEYNIGSGEPYLWDAAHYSLMTEYSAPAVRPGNEDGRVSAAEAGWRMQFISIMKKDDLTEPATNRFYNVTNNDDGYYILRLPFQLVKAPAEDDAVKPEVLHISLGPSSFVMTSGVGGTADDTQTYAWEAVDRTDAVHNLKNYFAYNGDLNIFADPNGGDTMNTLTVDYQTTDENDDTVTVIAQLYKDAARENAVSYSPDVKEYYMELPAGVTEVNLTMSRLEAAAPLVARYDFGTDGTTADTITPVEDSSVRGRWTAKVALSGRGAGDYQDTISITVNNGVNEDITPTVYLIHVKSEPGQTGEAYIKLYPGNSPYGLIERMGADYYQGDGEPWSEEKIAEAKEAFVNNIYRFSSDQPDGAVLRQFYSPKAWIGDADTGADDSNINLDLDPTMQAIFNKTPFKDAGWEAYYSDGSKVDNADVTRTIKLAQIPTASWSNLKNGTLVDANVTVDESGLTTLDVDGKSSNPGIYTMTYSFVDKITGETVETSRKVVLLYGVGDLDMSGSFDSLDATAIKNLTSRTTFPYTGVEATIENLHRYRIADADASGTVDSLDATNIKNLTSRFVSMETRKSFYVNIVK